MYLKFNCNLEFPKLGKILTAPDSHDEFEHDSENVYEWMYVKVPGLPFELNVSREHGWADIDDELLDINSDVVPETVRAMMTPGPVYLHGWDRTIGDYVDHLPDWLPQYIADRVKSPVQVYEGRINIDVPDPAPRSIVDPQTLNFNSNDDGR